MNVPIQRAAVERRPSPTVRRSASVLPTFLARRPSQAAAVGRWTVRGALVGVGPDGKPSCACMQTCDSEGNCSPCHCEPAGCGSCE